MKRITRLALAPIALMAVLVSAGCETKPGSAEPSAVSPPASPAAAEGLAATAWRLVAFQSMDDAQGTTKPVEGREYTLDFAADGTLAMQLDCNRGHAVWTATPGAGAPGGMLRIGPVATTRAFCPQPDMGGMIAARLSDVASYTLRDGHLFLALKMDGGIFEFAPR